MAHSRFIIAQQSERQFTKLAVMLTSNECSGGVIPGLCHATTEFPATTNEAIVRHSFCGFRCDFNRTASHRSLTSDESHLIKGRRLRGICPAMSNSSMYTLDYQSTSLAMHHSEMSAAQNR